MYCTKEGLEQDFNSVSRATAECFKNRNRVVQEQQRNFFAGRIIASWQKVQQRKWLYEIRKRAFLKTRNKLGEMMKTGLDARGQE